LFQIPGVALEFSWFHDRSFMIEKLGRLVASRKVLLLWLIGPLLIAGLCQLVRVGQYLFFQGDSTFPESAVVQTALWAKASGQIYPNLNQSPFTPAPYGPLFYAGLTALAKAVGGDFERLLVTGRFIVFAAFLLLVVAAYRWERQRLTFAIALVAPALILAQIDFEAWNASVRPDLPALLAGFAAFYFLLTGPLSWRRLLFCGCLCGVAGLLKQSMIALPLAVLLYLLAKKEFRAALAFAAGTAAVGIAVLAPLALRHEPVLREMMLARYSPTSVFGALQLLRADFVAYPWQIVFLGLGVLGLLRMDPKLVPARPLIAVYFVLAWLTGFYTSMAPGANMNAFLEAWIVTAICAPFAVADLVEGWSLTPMTARLVIMLLWAGSMLIELNAWRTLMSIRPYAYGELAQAVRGRHVLSDIPYVTAHGSQPELLDPSVNHYLELAGQWSPQPVLQELQTGSFDYVVVGLSGNRARQWRGLTLFSTAILAGIERDYRPLCVAERFAVYVPHAHTVGDAAKQQFTKAGCKAPLDSDPPVELLGHQQPR
jgi:hypothetical protein